MKSTKAFLLTALLIFVGGAIFAQSSRNVPLGEWSLPTNLKVQFDNGGHLFTITKIGNDYYTYAVDANDPTNYAEFYLKYKPASRTWNYYVKSYTDTAWKKGIPESYNEQNINNALTSTYFYSSMLTGRDIARNRPVIGTETVAGRSVEKRNNSSTFSHIYIDRQYNVALKIVFSLTSDVFFEVTSWDETVRNFGNANLPE